MQRLTGMSGNRWLAVSLLAVECLASNAASHAGDEVKTGENEKQVVSASVAETLLKSVDEEITGDEKSRVERLDKLIEAEPDAPGPRWQRGLMKTAQGWSDAADVAVDPSDAEKKYRELRDRTADDIAGNKQLAKFCQRNKLAGSAIGHWQRVLSFTPDDADARKALGHVWFDGTWTTKDEAKRVEKVRKEFTASLAAWSKKIPGWIDDWRSSDAKRKERGRENLLSIRDAAAIPLLQAGLAYRSEEDTVLLIEILCTIPDIHATRIIAELAVAQQSPQILRMCVEELKERDENSFVPQLLLALSSPVTSEMRLEMDPSTSRILYRHVFTREGQFTRQVEAVGRDYGVLALPSIAFENPGELALYWRPLAFAGTQEEIERKRAFEEKAFGSPEQQANAAFAARVAQSMAAAAERERRKVLENMSIEDTNSRVSLVLSEIFGENNGKPEQWWAWWNQRHETRQRAEKPTSMQVQYDQVVDGIQTGQTLSVQDAVAQGLLVRHGCFVAGTPVATPDGLKPIESLKTGDLVLAQGVESGEIAWKPVIQPTRRSATDVLKLTIGDEPFVCSLKHPFWKTGRGWIWAKELVVGDLVRTSNGSLPITEIEEQRDAPVFNLVVSDFSTYFVGKNRTLTHDITFRVPTLAIAPGVFPAREEVAKE